MYDVICDLLYKNFAKIILATSLLHTKGRGYHKVNAEIFHWVLEADNGATGWYSQLLDDNKRPSALIVPFCPITWPFFFISTPQFLNLPVPTKLSWLVESNESRLRVAIAVSAPIIFRHAKLANGLPRVVYIAGIIHGGCHHKNILGERHTWTKIWSGEGSGCVDGNGPRIYGTSLRRCLVVNLGTV